MKRLNLEMPEIYYILFFFLYLGGSSLAHAENGSELSLWLVATAILLTACVTILPHLGIKWLKLEKKGCPGGMWLALILQIGSWGSALLGFVFRLRPNLIRFHQLLFLTTFLWAGGLLTLLMARHACRPKPTHDTLKPAPKEETSAAELQTEK